MVRPGRKPPNSIIVYSAESGTTAQDGVFTPALLSFLEEPGLSFTDILRKTRQKVYDSTNGSQTPGSYDQLFHAIYLSSSTTSSRTSGFKTETQELTGMHFTNGYSADPTCAPSRAAIMTGQYAPRTNIYRVVDRYKISKNAEDMRKHMKFLPPDSNHLYSDDKSFSREFYIKDLKRSNYYNDLLNSLEGQYSKTTYPNYYKEEVCR